MTWRTEWSSISAWIAGLLGAGQFYLQSLGPRTADPYGAAEKHLVPQAAEVFSAIEEFHRNYASILPETARSTLERFLGASRMYFTTGKIDALAGIQIRLTALAALRTEFDYHAADLSAVARVLSERAFVHLQRAIVADADCRGRWKRAFREGETACEQLGAVHLLSHGIWAFKVSAEGERTDLVFGERLLDTAEPEATASALVLTEWKRAKDTADLGRKAVEAVDQAERYSSGVLAGIELATHRYVVLVSEEVIVPPPEERRGNVTYRHVNIAVSPKPPSKGPARQRRPRG